MKVSKEIYIGIFGLEKMRQMSDPNMLTMMLTVAHPVTTDTGFASKGFAADYHGAYMIKRGGKECLDINEGC